MRYIVTLSYGTMLSSTRSYIFDLTWTDPVAEENGSRLTYTGNWFCMSVRCSLPMSGTDSMGVPDWRSNYPFYFLRCEISYSL